MALAEISSALSIISSRFLDSVYRVGASIAGIALVVSWFSGEYGGPDEVLLSVLSALGIPTGWLDSTLLWMAAREEIVGNVGIVMIAISVVCLALTSSFSEVLSQRSSSTIWLCGAVLAVVGQGGAVIRWLVIGTLLSLIKDLVFMEVEGKNKKKSLAVRGRNEKDWDRLGARLFALVGALVFGPVLGIMKLIDAPRRR